MTIKEFRDAKKLTLRELASRSGVSFGWLSQIENSKAPVSAKVAQKLAKAMKIKKWWVLVSEGEQQ